MGAYLGGRGNRNLGIENRSRNRLSNALGSARQKVFTVDSNRVSQRHLKYSTSP